MGPSTVNALLIDRMIRALCHTLLHSLWQGILLAIITGAIVIFTKRSNPAFRYNLLIGALTLFALGVTATFIVHLQKPAAASASYLGYSTIATTSTIQTPAPHAISTTADPAKPEDSIAPRPGAGNITETVVNYFNTHSNTIVLIWFLIICAKSVQMAVGLHTIYRLKRTKVSKVGADWENRLLRLARQLHIEQTIRLVESGLAKVPMVVGHLKPVILIPVGLINSLTANEVEAILIHELAHIRRRDYLVNLLQSFMEILFFFNPAVLWISQLIKTERENCCDDLAIAQSCNKANYIRALLSCEEYQAAGTAYVMAFPGTKNTLLHRVNRIVGNRNYSLNLLEKTILAVCLVVMGLGISAFTAREHSKMVRKSLVPVIHHDSNAGHRQSTPVATHAAPVFQFQHPANPQLHLPAKPDTTKPALETTRAIARELYREQLLVDTSHLSISLDDRELIVNGVRMARQVYERIYRQFGRGDDYGGSHALPYEMDTKSPYESSADYQKSSADYQRQSEDQQKFWAAQQKKIIAAMAREGLIDDRNYVSFTLTDKTFVINGLVQSNEVFQRYHQEYAPVHVGDNWNWNYVYIPESNPTDTLRGRDWDAYSRQMAADRRQSEAETDKKLVADLLQDGLITDPNMVTFTLSDKTLIVNGKEQGAALHKKYKEKYRPGNTSTGWTWNYSHHE